MGTNDGRTISGIFCRRAFDETLRDHEWRCLRADGLRAELLPEESAVLLYHANACCGLDMLDYICFYKQAGFHVLAITIGGYCDSQGEPSEESCYRDADAAFEWLQKECRGIRPERIVAHGVSLGAALAFALAVAKPGLNVVADQAFTSAHDVAREVSRKASTLLELVPDAVVNAFSSLTFPVGVQCGVGNLTTDAFNNVAKAGLMKGSLFIIYSDADAMMPRRFAKELSAARYGLVDPDEKKRFVVIPGAHGAYFGDNEHAAEALHSFLVEQRLIATRETLAPIISDARPACSSS